MVFTLNENLKEDVMFDRMAVTKGPDKWRLAESLFHDDEEPNDPAYISFTATHNGEEVRLSVSVDNVGRVRNEEGMYRVKGIATIYRAKPHERIAEHVPLEVNFSVRTRKGVAQIQF